MLISTVIIYKYNNYIVIYIKKELIIKFSLNCIIKILALFIKKKYKE
jgi:hypothetical protein